jgi:hypothetical protein
VNLPLHQIPDKDGVYYAGPEVTTPRLLSTVYVPYPYLESGGAEDSHTLHPAPKRRWLSAPVEPMRISLVAFNSPISLFWISRLLGGLPTYHAK